MLSIVKKACWIRAGPSDSARLKFLLVSDSKIVGNNVVLSLQMCEILTAAEVLNTSLVTVW